MHEGDRDTVDTIGLGGAQGRPRRVFVQVFYKTSIGGQPLGHLGHSLIQEFRQPDMQVEQPGPRLIANPQKVPEPFQ